MVASTKRTARAPGKKYVPSAEQRDDDERRRQQFQNMTDAEMNQFVGELGKAVESLETSEGTWAASDVIAISTGILPTSFHSFGVSVFSRYISSSGAYLDCRLAWLERGLSLDVAAYGFFTRPRGRYRGCASFSNKSNPLLEFTPAIVASALLPLCHHKPLPRYARGIFGNGCAANCLKPHFFDKRDYREIAALIEDYSIARKRE